MDTNIKSEGGLGTLLKERVESVVDNLRAQPHEVIINLLLFSGIGVLSGFVCKKYSSHMLVGLAVLLGLFLLQQHGVLDIAVNWDSVGRLFGIQQVFVTSSDDFFSMAWEAIRLNSAISLSYAVGFIVGFKLG